MFDRFPEDKRVEEAGHMFATSQPVKIVVERRPDMTDAEHVDQQVRDPFRDIRHVITFPFHL